MHLMMTFCFVSLGIIYASTDHLEMILFGINFMLKRAVIIEHMGSRMIFTFPLNIHSFFDVGF